MPGFGLSAISLCWPARLVQGVEHALAPWRIWLWEARVERQVRKPQRDRAIQGPLQLLDSLAIKTKIAEATGLLYRLRRCVNLRLNPSMAPVITIPKRVRPRCISLPSSQLARRVAARDLNDVDPQLVEEALELRVVDLKAPATNTQGQGRTARPSY